MTKFTSYLKRTLSLLFLMVAMATTAWGGTATFTPENYYADPATSTQRNLSATVDGITISSYGRAYQNDEHVRVYANQNITITPAVGMTISQVVITAVSGKTGGTITPTVGTVKTSGTIITWTGSATETFILKNTAQLQWTKIEVTYTVTAPTTSYTVNFDAGTNGTCPTTGITEENPGDGVTLPDCTPNDGYAFVGWATSPDATTADAGVAGDTYNPTADVTLYAVYAKLYTVTIETPENGTLIVRNDETEVSTGSYVADGTELTIVATPNEGYKFRSWQYKEGDGSWVTKTANFTYTINSNNVSFQANFDEIVYNTITWSVNGVITTEEVENGTAITFAKPTENIPNGYEFMGWSATEIPTQQEAPTYVTDATAEGDITYYAVFAKMNGSAIEKTATLAIQAETETSNYHAGTLTDEGGNLWTYYGNIVKVNGEWCIGIRPDDKNSNIGTPIFTGNITNITLNTFNGSASSDRNLYICSSNSTAQPKNGDIANIVVPAGANNKEISKDITGSYSHFYIYSSAVVRISNIVVTYNDGTISYSDFCTSVGTETVAYTPATLTLKANSGDNYYATFSNEAATFFPETDADMTFMTEAQTAFSDGDELLLTTLATASANIDGNEINGYFVPANTGVLIKASFDKEDTTIPYYTVTGKTVDALEDNMLHPSSETMTGDYYFYKLAYDNISTKTGLGFYWGAENGGEFTSKSGLAYLAVPKTASAKTGFAFDNSTSGIESAATETSKNDVMYNLAGMRVNNNYKGIVIVNGKKMIRK